MVPLVASTCTPWYSSSRSRLSTCVLRYYSSCFVLYPFTCVEIQLKPIPTTDSAVNSTRHTLSRNFKAQIKQERLFYMGTCTSSWTYDIIMGFGRFYHCGGTIARGTRVCLKT